MARNATVPPQGLPTLMLRAAEEITLNGAALRHAQAALATGRVAEALVVLEAAEMGRHMTPGNLAELTRAKEAELLEHADMSDQLNLSAAFAAHQETLKKAANR